MATYGESLEGGGGSSVGFTKTTDVASATTITIPEPGVLIPVTGTTDIDFITKPTADAPRYVILWFQGICAIRNNVAGAPGGTANVRMMTGAAVNHVTTHAANSLIPLVFDGTVWRLAQDGPHWDGAAVIGSDVLAQVRLNAAVDGAKLVWNTSRSLAFDNARGLLTAPIFEVAGRPKYVQGSVASASNITLPANCGSVLVTGTTTVNTFTATGWEEGMVVYLEFNGILIITDNSGGANDFLAKTAGNITTAAGMVLGFRFDGTDMKEIGR